MWGEKWKIARDDHVIPPPPAQKGGTLLFGINSVAESAVKSTRRKQPKSVSCLCTTWPLSAALMSVQARRVRSSASSRSPSTITPETRSKTRRGARCTASLVDMPKSTSSLVDNVKLYPQASDHNGSPPPTTTCPTTLHHDYQAATLPLPTPSSYSDPWSSLQDGYYRANADIAYLYPSCMPVVDPVDPVHQNMSSQPYYDVAFNASSPSCSSDSTLYTPSSTYSPLHPWVETRGTAFDELARPASTSSQTRMSTPYHPLNTCNVATSNSTQWTTPYGLIAQDGSLCTEAMGDTVQRGQLDDTTGNLCSAELRANLELIISLLTSGHPVALKFVSDLLAIGTSADSVCQTLRHFPESVAQDYPLDYYNCVTPWNEQSYMDGPLYR